MPLFQIGYRRYEGPRTSTAMRWLPITKSGLRIAWQSKLVKRLVFVSFLPFLYFGLVFFGIGFLTDGEAATSRGPMYEILKELLTPALLNQLIEDPAQVRIAVWSTVFALFGTLYQILAVGLMAAIVGPSLVANDLRSRAFLIYFARPVSRVDYVIGKAGVLVVLLGCITLLPSLLLYCLSILFSPSLHTLAQTAPVLVPIFLSNLALVVPAALIVLTLSSLTRQPRYAAAGWVVICFFGPVAHNVLQATRGLRDASWTFLLSLFETARTVQLGLFDVNTKLDRLEQDRAFSAIRRTLGTEDSATLAALWLVFLSVVCVAVLLRRVDAPTRI